MPSKLHKWFLESQFFWFFSDAGGIFRTSMYIKYVGVSFGVVHSCELHDSGVSGVATLFKMQGSTATARRHGQSEDILGRGGFPMVDLVLSNSSMYGFIILRH